VLDKLPQTDVKAIMDDWLLEGNFPVVNVTVQRHTNTICFQQSAFLENELERLMKQDL